MSDDSAATLLLQLRLRAFAPAEVVAGAVERETDDVERDLLELESSGWVQHRSGPAAGWSLTTSGRRHGEALLAEELRRAGSSVEVEQWYQVFLELNPELLSVCTDWQTVVVDGEYVANDHTDPERDRAVLARLVALDAAAGSVTAGLAAALERFRGYDERLRRACAHVREGRTEWLAKPTLDSYHGIWFELHEHLLATLGRERVTERLAQYAPTGDTAG